VRLHFEERALQERDQSSDRLMAMRRTDLILLAAGVALGVVAEWAAFDWAIPFTGSGSHREVMPHRIRLVASARRPASRCGALMSATGFS
jgi:hypothetical protein